MRIESIELQDFRGISNLVLPIDKALTVIVGSNGVGKTSVLDAAALLLQGLRGIWTRQYRDSQRFVPTPKPSDVTYWKRGCVITMSVSADVAGFDNGRKSWSLPLTNVAHDNWNVLRNIPIQFQPTEQPLFVYYRQSRGFEQKVPHSTLNSQSENDVRDQSLSKNLHAIQELSDWWDKRDSQEARRHRDERPGYKDPQLQAIRRLIDRMDEFRSLSFESTGEKPGLYVRKPNGKDIHIDQLSSGERVFLLLLADLARRLQVIEPDSRLEDIPGIVLIDEIELNLHPAWQRKIIPTLTDVFKRCQFIVTTHSPQVLGEVSRENIRILSQNDTHEIEYVECNKNSLGRDSNEILLGILGASERDEGLKSQLEELEALITGNKLDASRALLAKLREKFDGFPMELNIAEHRLRRRARKLGG